MSCVALLAGIPRAHLLAQQATSEVVSGRVIDDSARTVNDATVIVTRGPDRLTLQTTSDSTGRYRVRFEPGSGDYLVHVSAPGFKTARRRVQHEPGQLGQALVADFVLARDLTVLAGVKVTANQPVRATNIVSPTQTETAASEKWAEGVVGQVPPTLAGDLGALAGTMSNITVTPNGPAILGSGPESNLTTLNGMGFAATVIPRAARTETRVTGTTFDPTRGGFSGANIDVRLGPGSRSFQRRNGFITLAPSQLQSSNAFGRAVGAEQASYRGSIGLDGELIRKALTYNVALDVARSVSDPATLFDADATILRASGVAPDSVVRISSLAPSLGLPVTRGKVPTQNVHRTVSWLGRLDDTRDSLNVRALTSYFGYTHDGALGLGPLIAPTAAAEGSQSTGGVQLLVDNYVGPGRRVLNETRIGASVVHTQVNPYLALPAATVLLRSPSADALIGTGVTGVTLGGNSSLASDGNRWTTEFGNETDWNVGGRRHRFKALLWGRADGLRQTGIVNQFGTFSFSSLSDLGSAHPSMFTRTLTDPTRAGTVWNAAGAFADQWAPTRFFSMLYGARVEANGFVDSPARNTMLEDALGVRSGAAPSRFHISPRVGFSYTYTREKTLGTTITQNPVGLFFRAPAGVIRGGIGEFRDLLQPGLLADASARTGLPGGTSVLSCVGTAVPEVDWSQSAANTSAIPGQCLSGSGVLGENASTVTLISPSYDVPRSWRASLDWSTNVGSWLLHLGGLAAYDLSQPGLVDANFDGTPRLTLAGEGGRPIYVGPTAIDPGSGAVSAAESRRSSEFGSVGMRVSDLRGYGGQFTINIAPDVFRYHGSNSFFFSTGYSLQWARRQYRGFDISTFGDPREKVWAPSVNDARHVLVLTGGFASARTGTVTLFARSQSGLPFTAVIQGDINGDGRGGDRAFIPNPATDPDPVLAQQLTGLMAEGGSSARRCLRANLGKVAPLNGCRGPWTQSLNIQWRPPLPARWGTRVTPSIYLQNVLAGVDQLMHGSGYLHGWGAASPLDPVLLIPRGYSTSAQSFLYDVNPRFADTRSRAAFPQQGFRVTLDFSLNLSTNLDLQQLRRAIEPIRGPNGWRLRSADSLTAFYLRKTSSIHKMLLGESDSLFLAPPQITALQRADSIYSNRVRALYVPLGQFLALGHGGAGKAELDSVLATQKTYWKIFWEQPEIADSIITPAQRELMPLLKTLLDTPAHERERSKWQFAHPVTPADQRKALP